MTQATQVRRIQPFKWERPQRVDKPKMGGMSMGRTDILGLSVQVVQKSGGENNLHAHTGTDSAWMVLKGRARFYGFGDALIAECGIHEGVVIPRGAPYWFEACSDEPLEILHITSRDATTKGERVNYTPQTARQVAHGRTPTREEIEAAEASVPVPE